MKKLSYWAIFLLTLFSAWDAVAGCPILTKGRTQYSNCNLNYSGDVTFTGSVNIPGGVTDPSGVKVTTGALSLYVTTTGSDTATCLVGAPCLTIAKALEKVPYLVEHPVSISLGSGSFAGFNVQNHHIGSGSLTILGVLVTSTPATGTATGTATSGTTYTLTDSWQSWTASDLVGRFLVVPAGTFLIQSNTSTSLTIIGANTTSLNGVAYSIKNPSATISSSVGIYGVKGNGDLVLQNLALGAGAALNVSQTDNLTLSVMTLTSPGTIGVAAVDGNILIAEGVYVSAPTYGGVYVGNYQSTLLNGVMSNGGGATNSLSGIEIRNVKGIQDMYAVSNGDANGNGILLGNSSGYATVLYASSNSEYGLKLIDNSHLGTYDAGVTTLSGTGNSYRGVLVDSFSELYFKGTPTLTGTLGNVTLDRGATTLSWASAFNDNGDMAVNPNLYCRVERKD